MTKLRPLLTTITRNCGNDPKMKDSKVLNSHMCEMPADVDQLPMVTPGKSIFTKFRRYIRGQCLVSPTNPRTKHILQSRATIALEKIRHLRFHYWSVHPFSNFRSTWELAMAIAMVSSLILLPFHISFSEHRYRGDDGYLDIGNLFFDFMCMADIIITFFTGTMHSSNQSITLNKDLIAREYLTGWFVPDAVTCLPYETMLAPSYSIYDDYWYSDKVNYLKCVGFVKVYRFRILYVYFNHSVKVYDVSPITFKIMHRIMFCGLYLHWMSCFAFLVPRLVQLGNDGLSAFNRPHKDSWLTAGSLWSADRATRYIHSWYHVIRVSLRVAFAHNVPITYEDTLLTMLIAALGFFLVVYVAGTSLYIISITNNSTYKYEEDTGRLKEFMRMKQLPPGFQRRLLMLNDFKLQKSYFKEREILATLTGQLRQEIVVHSCRHLVDHVTFFNHLSPPLLVRLVTCLRSEMYLAAQEVVQAGAVGDAMYFIASGSVAVYTPQGLEVCHLEDGSHFGEIALLGKNHSRVASVVALELSELYRLELKDFERIVAPFPDLMLAVEQVATERRDQLGRLHRPN